MQTDAVVQGQAVVERQGGAATLPCREPGATLRDLGHVGTFELVRFIRENGLSLELLDRD